mmetsp:Transcript_32651/g.49252  ORF Transcript_32651/g.49252 Transcript_32651/m.49252 type:complete len:479 (-) Transcript_32651:210-1646(-)|eukprot:scaffold14268_cov154-Skeletonema_dohrnii-CCMP3373.AAC.3
MTAEQNDNAPTTSDVTRDELDKKILVVQTILSNAVSSPHEILKQITAAINESNGGSKLVATILSGGVTNYSYKVQVDTHPHLTIFAKLSFEYALFNPSAHHDLARTQNEYDAMKMARNVAPNCVVSTLACWDLEHNGQKAKLLVTEWSNADEQFGIQFHEGAVDPRIAPQLADTIANLHTIESFDPDFNAQVKSSIIGLLEFLKQSSTEAAKKETPANRTEAYMAEVGADIIFNILKDNIQDFEETRDCLIHNDFHVFNILCEKKPSIEKLEHFGPDGTVIVCDWEQTIVGPIGRDIGQALAAPIGCLIGHMLNGYREASIDNYINTLLDHYFERMAESGKSEDELAYIYRNSIGWIGWAQYVVFYFMKIQLDAFGVESEELQNYMRDAMGLLGLKLMRLSYDKDYVAAATSLSELKSMFTNLIEEEVIRAKSNFNSRKAKMHPRKSSMLRASSRRVSDASMYLLTTDSLARELSLNL